MSDFPEIAGKCIYSFGTTRSVAKLEQYGMPTTPTRCRVHAEAALVSVDVCVCMSLDQ
jgi:hypothetical protein